MYNIMTPGPTQVRENVRLSRSLTCTNPDLDPEFYTFYKETCELISSLLRTRNRSLILGGEGILGLEAACATLTEPGDRVLVLDNGVFGKGFADFVKIYGGDPVLYTADYRRALDADALETTVQAFREKFGRYAARMRWLNLGGGHHITRDGYDRDRLIRVVRGLREEYGTDVYLEPGEAVVLNAGTLHAHVLETMHNGIDIAVLDVSAACHMPDVLEMPYRPPLQGSGKPQEKAFTYRLGGPTCLAGDIIGDYSFDRPLQEGDELVLEDMALYTMVKTNTFNGMPLPAIRLRHADGSMETLRSFGYEDFKSRL